MKQLVKNNKSGELKIIEMPPPVNKEGHVLVKNIYSAVSIGTESSSIRFAEKNLIGKALERSEEFKKVINLIVKKIKKGHANFAKIKMRNDEIMDLYPNLEKIKKIFNWKPRVNIQRGLIKTINHYAKK